MEILRNEADKFGVGETLHYSNGGIEVKALTSDGYVPPDGGLSKAYLFLSVGDNWFLCKPLISLTEQFSGHEKVESYYSGDGANLTDDNKSAEWNYNAITGGGKCTRPCRASLRKPLIQATLTGLSRISVVEPIWN